MGRKRVAERNEDGPPGRAVGRLVAELAGRQQGVVAAAQLRALGLDRSAVRRWVADGRLHRLHAGVFAVGHTSPSRAARYRAAVLAGGPDAALSHRTAAGVWDLRRGGGAVELTVPRARSPLPGITVHRSRMMDSGHFAQRDGIRVTSVARTLLDLAGVLTPRDLARAVDRAERLELFDLTQVESVLARARGRRGAAAPRRAIAGWQRRHTRSELEDRHLELVTAAGLPPPDLNVLLDGERGTHEVDAMWADHGLVVQLDGFAYHRTRRDRERDAATDADLELAGYRVMRLTWGDVTAHPARTARRLRLALHRAEGAPA